MITYITLFILSSVLSFLLTPIVRRKALAWGAVAVPDEGRHIHRQPTPRLGGVSIYLAFMLALACVPFLGNLVSDTFLANRQLLVALLAPATLVFAFGIYDDFRSAAAPIKVLFQTAATLIVFLSGYRIENLSSPFGGMWELPIYLSFPLTWLWIVGITNAFNLIDGIDGLAAGASVFALLSILIFSIAQGNPEISLLAVVLVGAVIGFLRYNFNPAMIFLGDSGSLFLGFMAATLSLAGSQKGSTIVAIAIPLVSFGLPVTEVGLSLLRRFLSGAPLLAGDRGHIHHRLLERGLTQRQAVILLYAVCAAFTLFGLMLLNPQRNIGALIFFVLGVGIIFGVQHLGYAEFSELGNQIRQGVSRGRRALAVGVRFRRAGNDLGAVVTPEELFTALDGIFETNEFDCAVLQLESLSPVFDAQLKRYDTMAEWADKPGIIWIGKRDAVYIDEIFNSSSCWTLTLPLIDDESNRLGTITFYRNLFDEVPAIDLGHICITLQQGLSGALSRILAGVEVR